MANPTTFGPQTGYDFSLPKPSTTPPVAQAPMGPQTQAQAMASLPKATPVAPQPIAKAPATAPKPNLATPSAAPSINPTSFGGPISPSQLEDWRSQNIDDSTIAGYMASAKNGQKFAQQLQKVKAASNGDPAAITGYLNWRMYGDPNYSPNAKPEDKSIWSAPVRGFDNAYHNFQQGLVNEEKILENYNQGKQGIPNTIAQSTGNLMSQAATPATGGLQALSDTNLPDPVGDVLGQNPDRSLTGIVKPVVQATMNSEFGRNVISPTIQAVEKASENSPTLRSAGYLAKGITDVSMMQGAAALPSQAMKGVDLVSAIGKNSLDLAGFGGQAAAVTGPQALAQEMIKRGVDERLANLVSESSPEDAHLMNDTISKYEAAKTDAMAANPAEVPGATALMRVRSLQPVQQHVGKLLGNVVDAVGDQPVNLQQTYDNFMSSLADKGVYLNEDGDLVSDTGSIPKSDLSYLQQIHDRINPDGGSIADFKDAHLTRQWLFKESGIAKANNVGYSDVADRIAGQTHSDMLAEMSQQYPQYYFPSKAYAETTKALDSFAKLMGKNSAEDLTDRTLRAGELARRLSSNASANSTETFDLLDSTARKFGFDSATDIGRQNKFVQMMSQYYPTYSQTSLQGQSEAAIKALGVAKDVANQNIGGLAMKGIQKVLGLSDEQQMAKQLLSIKGVIEKMSSGELSSSMSPEEISSMVSKMAGDTPLPNVRTAGSQGTGLPPEGSPTLPTDSSLPGQGGAEAGALSSTPPTPPTGAGINQPSPNDALTPEENATGLTGGGGDNMPRTAEPSLGALDSSTGTAGGEMGKATGQSLAQYNLQKSLEGAKVGDTVEAPISTENILPPEGIPAKQWTMENLAKRLPPQMSEGLAGPIEGFIKDGAIQLTDGVHRLGEAIRNGLSTIHIKIVPSPK